MATPGTTNRRWSSLSLSLDHPADPLFSALCCSDDPDLVPDDVEIVKPGWVVPHEEGRGKEVLHWLVYVTHLPSSLVTTHQRCTARTCNALLTDSICCARARGNCRTNIPGNDISQGQVLCDYLPPMPKKHGGIATYTH
jgi:hypothetical protein